MIIGMPILAMSLRQRARLVQRPAWQCFGNLDAGESGTGPPATDSAAEPLANRQTATNPGLPGEPVACA
jgi:hypothetical protein